MGRMNEFNAVVTRLVTRYNRTNKTSSYMKIEIILMISPHASPRSTYQVALLVRSPYGHRSP
jgi:hypothetical protein